MTIFGICRLTLPFSMAVLAFMYCFARFFALQGRLAHLDVHRNDWFSYRVSSSTVQNRSIRFGSIENKALLESVQLGLNRSLWSNCSWVQCPEAYGINRFDPSKRRVALFITGQLSRLELRSKMINVVRQNKDTNELYAIFLLKQGQSKSSNYRYRARGPHHTNTWSNLTAMKEHVRSTFPEASTLHARCKYTGTNLTRQEFYFVLTDASGEIFLRVVFGLTHKEPVGDFLLNPRFIPLQKHAHKENNHQDMFRNIRSAMILLEDVEFQLKIYMDYIFRLREDAFVLRPFQLTKFTSSSMVLTPRCWTVGGFTDVSFVAGRKVASKLLRGLAEDYYFKEQVHYHNPETFLGRLAARYKAQMETVSVCDWPVIPVIFLKSKGMLHMKLRGKSRRWAMLTCNSFMPNCLWNAAKEIVNGTIKPYSKNFTTWN